MLQSFYKFLVEDVLLDFFSKENQRYGNRYFLIIENNDHREGIIKEIKNYANPITLSNIYQNIDSSISEESYSTYVITPPNNAPRVIIGLDSDSTEDYLTTMRNTIGVSNSPYEKFSLLFILSDSSLSSIITACNDLIGVEGPLYPSNLLKYIRIKAENILTKDFEKIYFQKHIESIAESISDGTASLFDFSSALSALMDKTLLGHYAELGFFTDSSIYENLFNPGLDQMHKRAELNYNLFQKVSLIMSDLEDNDKVSDLEKFLDESMAKRIVNSDWTQIDFEDIKKSKERKEQDAKISFDSLKATDSSANFSLIENIVGNRSKKSKTYVIMCKKSSGQEDSLTATFNKNIRKEVNNNENLTIHGHNLVIAVKEDPIRLKIGKNDNTHELFILPIVCESDIFDPISDLITINNSGNIVVSLREDNNCFRLGSGTHVIDQFPLDRKIDWTNDYLINIKLDDDSTKENLTINFNGQDVKFLIKSYATKASQPLTPHTIDKNVTYHGISKDGTSFYKITDGKKEWPIVNYWQKYLQFEKDYIVEKELPFVEFEQNDISKIFEPLKTEISLPSNVLKTYKNICKYFKSQNTVPSLARLTPELNLLYQEYWTSIIDAIKSIRPNHAMRTEEYWLTKLGMVEYDNKVYFTPLHPIIVAYTLEYAEQTIDVNETSSGIAKKLLNPFYLIPHMFYNDRRMRACTDNEIENLHNWLSYEEINELPPERNNDITTKMVCSKMQEFIKHFNYLFIDINSPIIINTIGFQDDTNIIKGIVEFIKRQYSEGRVQKIEIHEYVSNLMNETFFEKLNRLNSVDAITNELERIGLTIEDRQKYTSQEIIHQLFTRVSLFKHIISESNDLHYCHIAFYQMDTGQNFIRFNTEDARTELSLHGLISIPSTLKKDDAYYIGYGTKNVDINDGYVFPMTTYLNTLYVNEESKGCNAYQTGVTVAKKYSFHEENLLNNIYQNSNWVTFINPEVDIDFFYNQPGLYVVHYTDQYTINAKYDSITVTTHIEQYKNMLQRPYSKYALSETLFEKFNSTMMNYFNCLNGSWMLSIVNKTQLQIKEKMSIVAASIIMQEFMKRNKNITWLPISLEEILRVTGSIGLPKDFIFSQSELGSKGSMSDDLLMMGVDIQDSKDIKMYFYPVEVKYSEAGSALVGKGTTQVFNTYKQLKESLFGKETFDKKIYRTFFASQFLTTVDKLKANNLISETEYYAIQKCRFKLLNLKYHVIEKLPVIQMGNAAVIYFGKDTEHKITTDAIQDVAICEIDFTEKDCYQYIADKNSEAIRYLQEENISVSPEAYDIINQNDKELDSDSEETSDNITDEANTPTVSDGTDEVIEVNQEMVNEDQKNEAATEKAIKIIVGKTLATNKDIVFEPNNTHLVSHPNMGIIGTMGTGKTQFARSLIAQFSKENAHNIECKPVGVLVFDYKGDYKDKEFLDIIKGEAYKYNYPFNPLKLVITPEIEGMNLPAITADRISDSFAKAYALGVKQQSAIKQIIIETYESVGITKDSSTWTKPAPTMDDVINKFFQEYDAKDSVYALFDKLRDYSIFTSDNNQCVSLFEWLDKVRVIDLTLYPDDTKKVIVSLILDLFYAEMKQLGSSKQADGYRQLRAMIMVDEAHQFLKKDFNSLRSIISEGRMFGVGMILSTQNISDFKTANEDYTQFILSWMIHHVNNIKTSDLSSIFGATDPYKENYLNFINKAEIFQSICKIGNYVNSICDLPYFRLIQEDPRFKSDVE